MFPCCHEAQDGIIKLPFSQQNVTCSMRRLFIRPITNYTCITADLRCETGWGGGQSRQLGGLFFFPSKLKWKESVFVCERGREKSAEVGCFLSRAGGTTVNSQDDILILYASPAPGESLEGSPVRIIKIFLSLSLSSIAGLKSLCLSGMSSFESEETSAGSGPLRGESVAGCGPRGCRRFLTSAYILASNC